MSEHPDETVVRRAIEAFLAGDTQELTTLFSPDVVWRMPGNTKVSGEFHGLEATLSALANVVEESGSTFTAELRMTATDGQGTVAALTRQTAQRNGHSFDDDVILVLKVENGRIVDGRSLTSNIEELERIWG